MARWYKLLSGSWGIQGMCPAPTPGEWVEVVNDTFIVRRVRVKRVTIASHGRSWTATVMPPEGTVAPRGRKCPHCDSPTCAKAWNQREMCDRALDAQKEKDHGKDEKLVTGVADVDGGAIPRLPPRAH